MDADDLMDIERSEKQYVFLAQNPEYDLVTTIMYSISKDNKVTGKEFCLIYKGALKLYFLLRQINCMLSMLA